MSEGIPVTGDLYLPDSRPAIQPAEASPAPSLSRQGNSIRDWPVSLRPRERLLTSGVEALSDAELLAIFLRTGTRGASAIDLARSLLARFGSLSALLRASAGDIMALKGVGEAKYAHLLAAVELGRRSLTDELSHKNLLNHPQQVKRFVQHQLGRERREVFAALFLDSQLQLIAFEKLFFGGVTSCQVHIAEVLRRALHHQAVQLIVCHNHPDAPATPSEADLHLTAKLGQLCKALDLQLVDHLICGTEGCCSLAEMQLMPEI